MNLYYIHTKGTHTRLKCWSTITLKLGYITIKVGLITLKLGSATRRVVK